jgi:glycogen synthase
VLEARALGRPVLVADTLGLRAFAQRGEAASVALDAAPAEVARAMVRQLRDPIAPPPPPAFTWDDCTDGLLDVYRRAVVA